MHKVVKGIFSAHSFHRGRRTSSRMNIRIALLLDWLESSHGDDHGRQFPVR